MKPLKTQIRATIRQIATRDFKAHLSEYLSQIQAGEFIEITSHKRVVARVIGVHHASDGLSTAMQEMVYQGKITLGNGAKPIGALIKLTGNGPTIAQTVIDDRG